MQYFGLSGCNRVKENGYQFRVLVLILLPSQQGFKYHWTLIFYQKSPLRLYTSFGKDFVTHGSKLEVTEVASFCKNGRKCVHKSVHISIHLGLNNILFKCIDDKLYIFRK